MNEYIKSLEEKNRRLHKKLVELEEKFWGGEKVICGKLIQANVPTRNGRIYTTECLQEMVNILNEKSKIGRCWVVLESDSVQIELDKIGAIALRSYLYNDRIYAHIKKVETPSGDILYTFLNSGHAFIIPMTIGTVNGSKNVVEVDDVIGYKLCTG